MVSFTTGILTKTKKKRHNLLYKEGNATLKPRAMLNLIEKLFSYIACPDGPQICSILGQYVQVYILSI